jgi:hypothetical protein
VASYNENLVLYIFYCNWKNYYSVTNDIFSFRFRIYGCFLVHNFEFPTFSRLVDDYDVFLVSILTYRHTD